MAAYAKLEGKKERNLEVVHVNHDTSQKAMDKYLVKSKINFPGLKQSETTENLLAKIPEVESLNLPTLVIADADGKVILSGSGPECDQVIAKMKKLASTATAPVAPKESTKESTE